MKFSTTLKTSHGVKNAVLAAILAAEVLAFTAVGGESFHSLEDCADYAKDIIAQAGHLLVLSAGMTIILMTGGIDLSMGSMTALVACVMASFAEGPAFWVTAVPAGLTLALLLGFTNGSLIAFLDMPPIVATLGTMIFYRGLCRVVMGDVEKGPFFAVPGYSALGGFEAALIALVLVLGAGGWLFHRSRWRREVLFLGGNRVAARYAGVPVARRTCEVYTLAGGLSFIAAILFTARNSSVSAGALEGLELKVIVAVVLGGTLVEGGAGSLLGSVLGVLVIAVLDEGLRGAKQWGDAHLPFEIRHIQYLALGGLLAAGVWLNTRLGRGPLPFFTPWRRVQ